MPFPDPCLMNTVQHWMPGTAQLRNPWKNTTVLLKSGLRIQTRMAPNYFGNPDPYYREKLDPDPQKSPNSRICAKWSHGGRSQWRRGGSVDQWLQIRINFMRSRIWIRFNVKGVICIRSPHCKKSSVEDPGCLSRIPDPDFYPSRIPDPKTATKERGEKNLLSYIFL